MPDPIPTDAAASKVVEAGLTATQGDTKAYTPTESGATDFTVSTTDPFIGATIGRYRLLKKLGEGGMGAVYLAEQSDPVKRHVALKLIRGNFDSRTILARFEAERQALAVMDHPNIARIYDGGVDSPRSQAQEEEPPRVIHHAAPYFVMELVQGVPITEYCDQHRLSPKQRLELFVPICQAVQHAHQKGIIHRDLKPSNVLVTEVDGKPIPKVIDFGVAKATEQPLTDQSLGDTGAIVGTPMYMSPEQADPESMDIDTRTDIYALGVMLYELLTGSTPIDAKQFRQGALFEVLRMVREVDPPRPSTKLSTAEALPSIAANRNVEPKQLQAMLRGDVDWIVMKAIEKDRSRRYETANGFAADVQRYLTGETVLAHPPSGWYRVKKFVRRNRVQVVAAGLVVMALVAGLAVSLWQMNRAIEAEEAALNSAGKEKTANELTAKRLGQIELINNSVFDIFTEFNILKVKEDNEPVEYSLAKRLIEMGKKLDAEAIHDPLMLANLQNRLGLTLISLGKSQAAIEFLTSSRDIRTIQLGPDQSDTLSTMNDLAMAYQAAGKLDLALPLYVETLKLRKTKLGPDHPDTLTSMHNLATSYRDAGKLDLALALNVETLKLARIKLGADHPNTLTYMNSLALGYRNAGKLDLALPLYVETLKLRKTKLGPDHPDTLTSMNNLAAGYQVARKFDLALPLFEENLMFSKIKQGVNHPSTLRSMNNLAECYRAAAKLDLALPLFEETLKLARINLGADHPLTLTSMSNLAGGYLTAGKLDLALPLFEETLKLRKIKMGADHPLTLTSMHNLAGAYKTVGKFDLALPLFEETVKLRKIKLGADHPDTVISIGNLAMAYQAAGKLDLALPLLKEVLAKSRKSLPQNSPQLAGLIAQYSMGLLEQKKWADAEPLLRECLAIREKIQPETWEKFNTQSLLGGALLGQKKHTDAEPLLLKGYEGMKRREKTISQQGKTRLPEALERLIQLYTETNKPDEVKKWQAEKSKLPKAVEKKP